MEPVQCPRCRKNFFCNAVNISNCGCMDIVLSAEVKQFLAEHYDRCLCTSCLAWVKQDIESRTERGNLREPE